ncbi:MAG TPA: helix-turn-helix domain-containing protein [Nocardioidaceae bacterium]|nr:helix-turn-helix domain-containing protein [Nocardioidaceae bacterium]
MTGEGAPLPDIEAMARVAVREGGGGFEGKRLVAFLAAASRAASSSARLPRAELHRFRGDGRWAAESGQQLSAVVDVYLSGARLLWVELASQPSGGRGRAGLPELGASIFRAVDDALAEVAAGYADARRILLRLDEERRGEFIEGLLGGGSDVSALIGRAEDYGMLPSGRHCVIVMGTQEQVADLAGVASDLEASLRAEVGGLGLLVTPRRGRLVAVLQSTASREQGRPPEVDRLAKTLVGAGGRLGRRGRSQAMVSVSRCRGGLAGIAAGYREADEGFSLLGALGWSGRVVYADELAVFRVLLRDRESMIELVESVLEPLRSARGGSRPLLETLHVYFSSGAVTTESARRLHLSVRAVSYRLDRVRALTGYNPTEAEHRLTLHVAVTGARLLGWS